MEIGIALADLPNSNLRADPKDLLHAALSAVIIYKFSLPQSKVT